MNKIISYYINVNALHVKVSMMEYGLKKELFHKEFIMRDELFSMKSKWDSKQRWNVFLYVCSVFSFNRNDENSKHPSGWIYIKILVCYRVVTNTLNWTK